MAMAPLLGSMPVSENGYPIPSVTRVWQGKSVENAAVPTTGAAIDARPSGVNGDLLCRVMNTGANPAFFYFSATSSLTPLPGTSHARLAANASAITILKADERYVIAAATTATTTVRVEFLNQEL